MRSRYKYTLMFVGYLIFVAGISIALGRNIQDDGEICDKSLIRVAGLRACHDNANCNLSNDELHEMYVSGKNAIMACARAATAATLYTAPPPQEEQEEEPDKT